MKISIPLSVSALSLLGLNVLAWQAGWLESLIFDRAAFRSGRWWVVLTHPFVHVSWYHLLLDGAAFIMLMQMLELRGAGRRIAVVAACAAGALVAVLAFGTSQAYGYCGLSGVAHGLVVFTSLEMIRGASSGSLRRLGWLSLVVVLAKSVGEACTGTMLLTSLHFGLMGVPVAVAHLGGAFGGLLAFAIFTWDRGFSVEASARRLAA